MSRWKRLEDIEEYLPDMSAEELREAIQMWQKHMQRLHGPALKLALKFRHRLQRALELRTRSEEV